MTSTSSTRERHLLLGLAVITALTCASGWMLPRGQALFAIPDWTTPLALALALVAAVLMLLPTTRRRAVFGFGCVAAVGMLCAAGGVLLDVLPILDALGVLDLSMSEPDYPAIATRICSLDHRDRPRPRPRAPPALHTRRLRTLRPGRHSGAPTAVAGLRGSAARPAVPAAENPLGARRHHRTRLPRPRPGRLPPRPNRDGLCGARLTEREGEVLRLMATGRSNAEIAAELFLGVQTIKTHVSNVLAKLGARDRTQAVVFAYESGFVDPRG